MEKLKHPLYIGSRASVKRQGPSLLISSPDRSDGRYPLGRISRVLASAHSDIHWQAIVGCMEYGIPFNIERNGSVIGCFVPPARMKTGLDSLLRNVLGDDDLIEYWQAWVKAEEHRMMLLSMCYLNRNYEGKSCREAMYCIAKDIYLRGGAERIIFRHWNGCIQSMVTEFLINEGVSALCLTAKPLALLPAFSKMLLWPLRSHLMRYHAHWQQQLPIVDKQAMAFICLQEFERCSPQLQQHLKIIVRGMHQQLLEDQS